MNLQCPLPREDHYCVQRQVASSVSVQPPAQHRVSMFSAQAPPGRYLPTCLPPILRTHHVHNYRSNVQYMATRCARLSTSKDPSKVTAEPHSGLHETRFSRFWSLQKSAQCTQGRQGRRPFIGRLQCPVLASAETGARPHTIYNFSVGYTLESMRSIVVQFADTLRPVRCSSILITQLLNPTLLLCTAYVHMLQSARTISPTQ